MISLCFHTCLFPYFWPLCRIWILVASCFASFCAAFGCPVSSDGLPGAAQRDTQYCPTGIQMQKTAGGVCGRLYVADGQIVRKTIVKKV